MSKSQGELKRFNKRNGIHTEFVNQILNAMRAIKYLERERERKKVSGVEKKRYCYSDGAVTSKFAFDFCTVR